MSFTRYNLPHSFDRAQAQLEELYAKQGRISRFKSQTERGAYLKKEIAAIDKGNKYLLCASNMKVPWAAPKSTLLRLQRPNSLEDREVVLQTLAAEISELKKNHVATKV